MRNTVAARRILGAGGAVDYPLLTLEDGVIRAIESLDAAALAKSDATHRFPDAVLVPAFVDVHLHGGAGHDVMEATAEAIDRIGSHLSHYGVGAYLPTTVTSPVEQTLTSLTGLARQIERLERTPDNGATPLGIHLEGPFLSHRKRGAHTASLLEAPSIALFDRFYQAAEGRIMLMTIAPELPDALELIAYATSLGVRCSLGHSAATVEQTRAGIVAGAVSATHTFNAMSGLDHRSAGMAAVVLDEDALYAELIADGLHVDPLLVRLFAKAKPSDRMLLITDGISATAMPNGKYLLGSMEVDVRDGRCTTNGTLAGSVLTLDRGVRNLMEFARVDLHTAAAAAATNPAQMIGRSDEWGSLHVGGPANFTVLSVGGDVMETFLRGVPRQL